MDKIIKKDFRKEKSVTLPKSGLTVVIYSSILTGDLIGVNQNENDVENGLTLLVKAIKSWNLYASEADEKPVEINKDNLKSLPMEDFVLLQKEFGDFFGEQKKT